jgi:hypothetical protein
LKRLFKASAAVFAALALVIGSANIAQAVATRTLATGNVLYGLDGAGAGTHGTLYNIDPLTGAVTTVGSRGGAGTYDYPYQGAYNPVDGQIYWSGAVSDGEHLWKTNPTTGTATLVANFTENGANATVNALAIGSDGHAFGTSGYKLFSVNLTTGVLTRITASLPNEMFYAFAYNPADSLFYAVANDDLNGGLFTVDVTDGTTSRLIPMANFPNLGAGTGPNARRLYSIAFDKNGSLWGTNQNGEIISNVVTGSNAADFITGAQVAGLPGSTWASGLAITYPTSNGSEESLANTGTQDGVQAALATGAALAITIGATLTFYARRRTR